LSEKWLEQLALTTVCAPKGLDKWGEEEKADWCAAMCWPMLCFLSSLSDSNPSVCLDFIEEINNCNFQTYGEKQSSVRDDEACMILES